MSWCSCVCWIFSIVLSHWLVQANIRCFECTNVASPGDCALVVTCSSHEICYLESGIADNGRTVYNSGCRERQKCQTKKRSSFDLLLRNVAVTTCIECCDHAFCNNAGCGHQAVDRNQRGPYCYNCAVETDPLSCRHVVMCTQGETCMLRNHLYTVGVYMSHCATPMQCEKVETLVQTKNCPRCCTVDFCNDACAHTHA
ncbi:uncharacterized protein LOC127847183 [Dreissena polymorpha]|nr:uncharacterized protein LOC127847183 [Dreissena polymorpha]